MAAPSGDTLRLAHFLLLDVERHPGSNRDDTRWLEPGAAVALTFIPIVNAVGLFFSLGWRPGPLLVRHEPCSIQQEAPATG